MAEDCLQHSPHESVNITKEKGDGLWNVEAVMNVGDLDVLKESTEDFFTMIQTVPSI
jgi:hypothetical protein